MRRNRDQTCRRVSEGKIVSTRTAWGFLPRLYVEERRRGPVWVETRRVPGLLCGFPHPHPLHEAARFTDGLVASAERASENWCFIPLLVSF